MIIAKETYFGVISECLDIFTLSYRWFGCVWFIQGSNKVITDFWFADTQYELEKKVNLGEQLRYARLADSSVVKELYEDIRKQQARHDWNRRSRLPFKLLVKEPWRSAKTGWYVLRSRGEYPDYVAAICKRKRFAWIEHVALCETEQDLHSFMAKVNNLHKIQLTIVKNLFSAID